MDGPEEKERRRGKIQKLISSMWGFFRFLGFSRIIESGRCKFSCQYSTSCSACCTIGILETAIARVDMSRLFPIILFWGYPPWLVDSPCLFLRSSEVPSSGYSLWVVSLCWQAGKSSTASWECQTNYTGNGTSFNWWDNYCEFPS